MKLKETILFLHTHFLTMFFFYCCEKVLTLTNTWMIAKSSMKHPPLPEKEDFYSHLSMEDITDSDYKHGKRVCKDVEK